MDSSPPPFPVSASCVPAIRHWMAAGPGRARGGTRGETEPTELRPPGVDRRGGGETGGHGAGGLRAQPRRLVFWGPGGARRVARDKATARAGAP